MIGRAELNNEVNHGRRGIVVSDEPETGARLKAFLTTHLWRCDAADVISGAAAAQRLHENNHDLIVCALPRDVPRAESLLLELRSASSSPLVAVGPADDPKLILHALHEGEADEYVDVDDLDEELGAILERLRPASHGAIVAVVAPGGGAGASTIAANLAVLFSQPEAPCVLIDMNSEFGVQASLLDLKPTSTIVDLCQNLNRIDAEMFEQLLTRHKSGVALLAAPMNLGEAKHITREGTNYALKLASQMYPYCVVDADPRALAEQVDLFHHADVVLLVFSPTIQGLHNVRHTLAFFEQARVDLRRFVLVLNRDNEPHQLRLSQVRESFRDRDLQVLPYAPKVTNRSSNVGIPAVTRMRQSKFSRKLSSLAEKLREKFPPRANASRSTEDVTRNGKVG